MSKGLPCLRWSTEPKRREFVVDGVEEASRVCTSAPLVLDWFGDELQASERQTTRRKIW